MEPDNNDNQPKPMTPDTLFTPSVSQGPPAPTPAPSPAQPPMVSPEPSSNSGDAKTKKLLIILGVIVGVFVLLVIIVLIASSGGKKADQTDNTQTNQTVDILSPPSAIDIENANNSISSAITGLNDDSDFPAANLSDDNLEL